MRSVLTPRDIAPIRHAEAMELAAVEYERSLDLLRRLDPADWQRPTDCDLWDVKALVSHVVGTAWSSGSLPTGVREAAAALVSKRRTGNSLVDEINASQVRRHAPVSPSELVRRAEDAFAHALSGRSKLPAFVRGIPFRHPAPISVWAPVGFLYDIVYTRDLWMHRVDITRATGKDMDLTRDHDGRLVADVVREWATRHGQPFELHLEGAAGGDFVAGSGGEVLRLDAVEFCRTLSGRVPATGLLAEPAAF